MKKVSKEVLVLPNGDIMFWESKELRDIVKDVGDMDILSKKIFGDIMLCG